MSLYVPVNGSWRNVIPYVPVAGTWRQVPQIYVPVNGTWRGVYSYYWEVGGWGGCSVACGGGVQYRNVYCRRAQGNVHFADSICQMFVGGKPATSQACNTHSCVTVYTGVGSCEPYIYNYATYGTIVNPRTVTGWISDDSDGLSGAYISGNRMCAPTLSMTPNCSAGGKTYTKVGDYRRLDCRYSVPDGDNYSTSISTVWDLRVA